MAAQHLPRDLVRPSSGLNNWRKRRRIDIEWATFSEMNLLIENVDNS